MDAMLTSITKWTLVFFCTVLLSLHTATPAGIFPPQITKLSTVEGGKVVTLEGLVVIKYVKSKTITCKADGVPKPTFEWYRDKKLLSSNDKMVEAFDNGNLILTDFNATGNGYYHCRAKNPHGTSVSDEINIVKDIVLKRMEEKPELKEYNEKEGDSFALRCSNNSEQDTVTKMTKRWYFGGNNQLKLSNRVGVDDQGTLRIAHLIPGKPEAKIKEVQLGDEREYRCGLVGGESIMPYPLGRLTVAKAKGNLDPKSPRLTYSTPELQAIIGQRATMTCFFASYPEASITWKDNHNLDIKADNTRFENHVNGWKWQLNIIKVEEGDEGTFTCTGKNGIDDKTGKITVNVTSPPIAKISLKKGLTKPTGEDVTLYCKTKVAHGERLDSTEWFRNGIPLTSDKDTPDPGRYHFNSDFTELTITKLKKPEDTACFQCNATNSEGYKFMDGYLRVINSISVTGRPKEIYVIQYGDAIDFTVRARGDSCCPLTYNWKHDETPINPKGSESILREDAQTKRMTFNTSWEPESHLANHTGVYTCRVSDGHQEVIVKITVQLKSTTHPGSGVATEPAAASIGVWWIGLLLGIIAIIIAIIIVIFIYKSNYPQSSYNVDEQEVKHQLDPEQDLLDASFQEI